MRGMHEIFQPHNNNNNNRQVFQATNNVRYGQGNGAMKWELGQRKGKEVHTQEWACLTNGGNNQSQPQ